MGTINVMNKVLYVVVPLAMFLVSSSQKDFVVQGRLLWSVSTKPDPNAVAATARWLISHNFWGVLKYILYSLCLFIPFSFSA